MQLWRRLLNLIYKEFLTLWKDKRGRAVLIAPPIVQGLVFGYAASFDLNHVALAVYDEDGAEPARQLIAKFQGAPAFDIVENISNEQEIASLINRRDAALVLHLGPNFSRDVLTGEGGHLQAIVDGRDSNTAMIVLNYVQAIVRDFNLDWADKHGLPKLPASLTVRSWFNPNLESRWFILPGLVGIITMVISTIITALSVAREREEGTMEQLLVTPLRPFEILIGKTLPAAIIGIAEASIVLLLALFWFKVPMIGNVGYLYLGITLFLLSTIGLGLMISTIVRTQQQAFLGAFLFLVPAIILSGFATPLNNMPQIIQTMTLVNPLRYFLEISRGVFLENLSLPMLFHQLWPLALIGVIAMSIATVMFRRRLY